MAILGILAWSCTTQGPPLDQLGQVHMLDLKSSNGEALAPDFFNQSITVVEFFFTSCQGACPLMNTQMKAVYDKLDPTLPVRFLSVTIDPDRDTFEKLRKFQVDLKVDPERWIMARGNLDSIRFWIEDDFHLGVGSLPAEHPTRLILVDQNQQIRGYFDGLSESSVKPLIKSIRHLLTERNAHAA